jgi:hypothetical protein
MHTFSDIRIVAPDPSNMKIRSRRLSCPSILFLLTAGVGGVKHLCKQPAVVTSNGIRYKDILERAKGWLQNRCNVLISKLLVCTASDSGQIDVRPLDNRHSL